ncbi:MAG: nuclear transport factor 2 family protein [Rhodoblastus sp.]
MLTSDAKRKLSDLDRDLIEQRLNSFQVARQKGDMASIARLLAEDCAFRGATWVGQMAAVRRQGRAACLELFQQQHTLVECLEAHLTDLAIDASEAAVCCKVRLRSRGAGRVDEIAICSYIRFKDSEIIEIDELADNEALARLFRD